MTKPAKNLQQGQESMFILSNSIHFESEIASARNKHVTSISLVKLDTDNVLCKKDHEMD